MTGVQGGNPDLRQEVADTLTWGIILTPTFVENLTISVDWYDIELKNAVNLTSAQNFANLCVDLAASPNEFCDVVPRAGDGTITSFTQEPKNVETYKTRGIDFSIAYQLATDHWGTFDARLFGNHLQDLQITNLPGAASISMAGQKGMPEWQKDNASLRWQLHYFSETDRFDKATVRNNPNIVAAEYLEFDRALTHDIYGSYSFNEAVTVYVGLNNVTDERPDIGETFYPVSAIGRYLFAGFNVAL